ncbi:MAG: HelD family protein [Brevibacterium yomogidense]|uniref:HelD family protein n=1 Tax=Brevibacterium sp. Mu109 TaxID=1255669 RepID=UPI000C62E539|nr:DNA helicase [Brevibacterium sp. Mu109]SMX68634.1 DNA helicase IV [Brevibacterium sp. Mu109]
MTERSEIAHEQAQIDTLYARLDELRAETRASLSSVRRSKVGGHHQNRSERDAFATMYEDALIRYQSAEDGLCFGRIDASDGETTYIGRIGLSAQDRTQLLMDWRAPASEPFYRATAAEPSGLVRRRHIATRARTVTGVEDDVLDLEGLDEEERSRLQGEGALMASLDARRTGRMGDIVATIQSEQDRIIRRDLAGTLVVQGGPGTGKTAVALHRAAYLLYRHRQRIAKSGVLLIGPSPVFLRYIERVLPSLGETGAVLLTPGQLMPGVDTSRRDAADTAAVKGDLRMADVVRKMVRSYQRVPTEEQRLGVGPYAVTLRPSDVRTARERARRTDDSHNAARTVFVQVLLRSLAEELARAQGLDSPGERLPELLEDLRASRDVRIAVNLCWLPLTTTGVLDAMLSKRHRLTAASRGILSAAEVDTLLRPKGAPLTVEDVPLLDEIAERIGTDGTPADRGQDPEVEYAEAVVDMTDTGTWVTPQQLAQRYRETAAAGEVSDRAANDREWTFGHLVADEAQELSPMQLRLLFRRVPSKSATLVGDLAQASATDASRTWHSVLSPHVGDRFGLEELTVSYRTPRSIMGPANALLAARFPALTLPEAVRDGDESPRRRRYDSVQALVEELPAIIGREAAAVDGGRVAVIVPEALMELVEHAIAAESAESAEQSGSGALRFEDVGFGPTAIDHRIAVLTPYDAKGLEFDSVIVAEPALIAPLQADPEGDRSTDAGIGALYVALTRSTSRLAILAANPSILDEHFTETVPGADAPGG